MNSVDGFLSGIRFLLRKIWRGFWYISITLLGLLLALIVLLRWLPVPTSAFMLQHQLAAWYQEKPSVVHYQWVDYEDISPQLALAVIASEDQLFTQHYGIDIHSTWRAIQAAWHGDSSHGGSTITQQVAKNLFLWGDKHYVRKVLEWGVAGLIELFWSKRRILEIYLNIAQFDSNIYGVGAASERLLKVDPANITANQAALMAAVLPLPARYSVVKPSAYIKKRQRQILKQMRLLGGLQYLKALEVAGIPYTLVSCYFRLTA